MKWKYLHNEQSQMNKWMKLTENKPDRQGQAISTSLRQNTIQHNTTHTDAKALILAPGAASEHGEKQIRTPQINTK